MLQRNSCSLRFCQKHGLYPPKQSKVKLESLQNHHQQYLTQSSAIARLRTKKNRSSSYSSVKQSKHIHTHLQNLSNRASIRLPALCTTLYVRSRPIPRLFCHARKNASTQYKWYPHIFIPVVHKLSITQLSHSWISFDTLKPEVGEPYQKLYLPIHHRWIFL